MTRKRLIWLGATVVVGALAFAEIHVAASSTDAQVMQIAQEADQAAQRKDPIGFMLAHDKLAAIQAHTMGGMARKAKVLLEMQDLGARVDKLGLSLAKDLDSLN